MLQARKVLRKAREGVWYKETMYQIFLHIYYFIQIINGYI